jgi:drug/metabolite transporter (DMT)-like permease
VVVLVAAAGTLAGWRHPRGLAWLVVGLGAAPTVAYGAELWRLPGGSAAIVTVVLGLFAAIAAAVSLIGRLRRPLLAGPLLAGAGAALLVAGWRHRDVLDHSVLTTSLPTLAERLIVVAALGLGAAALVVGVAQTLGLCQPPATSASASTGPHEPRG